VLIANNRMNEAKDLLSKAITSTDEQKEKKSKLQAQL
jgi:hypothetical protein